MTRPALYSDSSIRTVYAIYVVNTSLVKTSVKTALQIADGRSGGIRRANMRATVLLSLLSIGSAPVSPPSPPPPRTCDHHCASCDGTSCTNCVTANHGCTCAPLPRSPPVDAAIADALLAADGNQFYRNPDYDTVYATKVADGAITLDGDLSDWDGHAHQYRDVAFATVSGDEVIFEHYGTTWTGPEDFSVGFMLSWDSSNLYLAIEVVDDIVGASGTCYANGVQTAFEVAGAQGSASPGMLQAERSPSTAISRLQLINLGLRPESLDGNGGAFCDSQSTTTSETCCVDYELCALRARETASGVDALTHAASTARWQVAARWLPEAVPHRGVARRGHRRHDVRACLRDCRPPRHLDGACRPVEGRASLRLLVPGQRGHGCSAWMGGADRPPSRPPRTCLPPPSHSRRRIATPQAGYYPHSMVHGWNGGQKEPGKTGVVQLAAPQDGAADCLSLNFELDAETECPAGWECEGQAQVHRNGHPITGPCTQSECSFGNVLTYHGLGQQGDQYLYLGGATSPRPSPHPQGLATPAPPCHPRAPVTASFA